MKEITARHKVSILMVSTGSTNLTTEHIVFIFPSSIHINSSCPESYIKNTQTFVIWNTNTKLKKKKGTSNSKANILSSVVLIKEDLKNAKVKTQGGNMYFVNQKNLSCEERKIPYGILMGAS